MSRASLKSVSRLIDIANEEKSVEEQFLTDLCRSIELDSEKYYKLPSKTFKPSSLTCGVNSYYQIMGVEPDKGSASHNMIGIVNSGSDIHERIQSAISKMKDNGMYCEYVSVPDFIKSRELDDLVIREQHGYETKLYNTKYNISFMLDGIIKYRGKYYILEIKTETSNKWYSRDGVDKKHYNQAIAYSLNMGLDDVMFLYIDRDMLGKKTFLFHVTDEMRRNMIDYIETVNGYVERQIVPPKPENITKNICAYCNYQIQCKKDH